MTYTISRQGLVGMDITMNAQVFSPTAHSTRGIVAAPVTTSWRAAAMARDEQAMSAARLAAIRERWLLRHKAHVQTVYGQAELYRQWLDNVGDDETALLAEVERLRAREAALVAVVERVAVVDIAERITPRAVIQQARAVLASAGESIEEGGGDGA